MRSRLVHEWRGVVGGWYFVPFQTRRKPQRQDFGVRLKSCRLNLRSPGQSSIHRNPSIVFPRGLLLFRLSSFSRWLPSTSPWLSSATAKHVAAKAPKLLPFSTFILTVGPWNVYGTRKLTAAKTEATSSEVVSFAREDCVGSGACESLEMFFSASSNFETLFLSTS